MLSNIFKRVSSRSFASRMMRGFSGSSDQYDVAVIGGGPGGYVAAIKAAQLGLKTACIEGRGALGGTCLNVGCIPSKALLQTSHHYEEAKKHFNELGIDTPGGVEVNWPQMQKKKDGVVTGLTKGIEGLFAKNKVTYVRGYGSFTDANTIQTDSGETVNAKNVIIATGSAAASLPGVEVDEEHIVTSTGALALSEVPENLVVIGAGVIGLELGSVYQRLGSQVTVVEFLNRVTPGLDSGIAKEFQKVLKQQGMKFKLNHAVNSATYADGECTVSITNNKNKKETQLKADAVLLATGRVPYTEGLGLENVGVEVNERGQVVTDAHWCTNIPNIYAIGDVITGPMLAHKAEEEGIAVVEQLAGKVGHVDYNAIPGVIYTHPEVATVGMSEDEAKEAGIKYSVGTFPFMANSRARANQDHPGMVKIVTETETDKLLGAHIIGPQAGELITSLTLSKAYGASSEDVARVCHAHPTLSEAVKEACLAAHDKPIHM